MSSSARLSQTWASVRGCQFRRGISVPPSQSKPPGSGKQPKPRKKLDILILDQQHLGELLAEELAETSFGVSAGFFAETCLGVNAGSLAETCLG